MENDYDRVLLNAVKSSLSSDISPVDFIMDVLCIGKEAVYRRLRGEVPLTLKEAALLSKKLGISLNGIVDADPDRIHHYSFFHVNFEAPSEADYRALECHLDNLRQGCSDPWSQMFVTAATFPQPLYLRYKNISRFALFKWIFQEGKCQVAFHKVRITERMQQIFRASCEIHRQISTTYYIFDHQLSSLLADDLKYFTSIGLLRDEDAESIRSEVHNLLDYMEQIAITGKYENGNEVQIYVSNLNFNKSYYNIKAGSYYLSAIETCVLNSVVSTEQNCYRKMNDWLHYRRRISTLISHSGEPLRVAFFKDLRRLLDE